ncbi:hypothetical protein N0V88_006912 [Collariella sp. IMI 366227]|nr:hypothetical protein N0V88_006912 [Collariella sp. IMI 366227]
MSNNPWQRVCDLVAALPNLQDLHVWIDSADLRPWHKRVSETRFFARLMESKRPLMPSYNQIAAARHLRAKK